MQPLIDNARTFGQRPEEFARLAEGQSPEVLFITCSDSRVMPELLAQTERGVNEQLQDLRPILRTVIGDSDRIRRTLQTLATFSEYWPESMPGNYLQLDVCQAPPDMYNQGTTCPQSVQNDEPGRASREQVDAVRPEAGNTVEYILRLPLVGVDS